MISKALGGKYPKILTGWWGICEEILGRGACHSNKCYRIHSLPFKQNLVIPYPSLSSPDRFPKTLTPTPSPTASENLSISKEQAIETASKTLRQSIVSRAEIKAEMHGWYWEVIFDNLNAKADELMPWPLKGPPPPPPGQPTSEPYPGIWQSVIITIDAQTGHTTSAGARRAPKPGPYVSQSQAIESARGDLF